MVFCFLSLRLLLCKIHLPRQREAEWKKFVLRGFYTSSTAGRSPFPSKGKALRCTYEKHLRRGSAVSLLKRNVSGRRTVYGSHLHEMKSDRPARSLLLFATFSFKKRKWDVYVMFINLSPATRICPRNLISKRLNAFATSRVVKISSLEGMGMPPG